jgi:hypothetical protein
MHPLGRWSLAQGTFSMMDEVWEFRPDGTGSVTYTSGMSGTEREPFLWRAVRPFHLEICWPDEPPDPWVAVEYELVTVTHDAGQQLAMRQVGRQGFLTSPLPLAFLGP